MDDIDPTAKDSNTPEPLSTAALVAAQPVGSDGVGEARSFADAEHTSNEPALGQPGAEDGKSAPLFSADETGDLRAKWDTIQAGFVDAPRKAVEQADGAVAQAMKRLAEMFAQERASLEGQWDRGDDVSTEELRLALRRYRSFFDRLLSI